MTVEELLKDNGIKLKDTRPGRHYTTCPECSAKRSKVHQRAEVLGVTIKGDTVYWGCNHCGWKGPEKGATNGAGDTRSLNGSNNVHHLKTTVKTAANTQPEFEREPKSEKIIDWRHPEAEFVYVDDNNDVIYKKVRFPILNADGTRSLSAKGKPDKTFVQYRKEGDGFVKGLGNIKPVPYELHNLRLDIQEGWKIHIVEGEAKADALRDMGLAATSIPNIECLETYGELFRCTEVALMPDNDASGKKLTKSDWP